jgi:hypothetical protein
MSIEISNLLLQEQEGSSTVKVFNETIHLQKEMGYIFGVLESGHAGQDLLLEYAINQFRNYLPATIKKLKKANLDEIFEQTLQDINQNLTNYIQEKNILVDFDNLNGVIALLDGKNLYFTYLGKITTLLIHKIGKDNYKVIDILDNISGSAVKPTAFKIFSNVISGQVQNEDSLFFSTANVLDIIDTDRLKEIVISCHTDTVIDEIKKILNKLQKNLNFGGVLLKLNPKRIEAKAKCEEAAADLAKEVKKKDSMLARILSQKTRKQENTKTIKKAGIETIPEKINIVEEQPVVDSMGKENEDVETQNLASQAEPAQPTKIAEKISEQINQTKKQFLSWKRVSQVLFVLVLILAIFFVQSLKNKSQENLAIQQEKDYAQKIQTIEDKLTEANAKLIIDEKDDAMQLIEEVNALIAQLPASKQAQVAEFSAKAERYLNKIRNITKIDDPKIVAELANPAIKLIKQQNAIYLYNSDNSLYKLNLSNNKINVVATKIEDKGEWQKNAPDVEEGKTLLLYNGSGISQYDFSANELETVEIPLPNGIKIDDLNFYGQKLYLIDGANNKIYKHIKLTQNSFNSGASWLLDNTDLSGAVSMAIDSNIWVLKSSGEIIKLFKGKRADFKLKTIDPPLKLPTKIYTTLEMDNIYILEPTGKRLVVIDKLGNLLGQYYSPQFDDLKDFVLEKDKEGKEAGKVYLLNGLKVFEIDVE